MSYNEGKRISEGRQASYAGLGPEANPYQPKTNFHRLWASGHAMVKQASCRLDHTYQIGDRVKARSFRLSDTDSMDTVMEVEDIFDVPRENILFNPHIPEEVNETGVGHHQHLKLSGKNHLVSGAAVQLA